MSPQLWVYSTMCHCSGQGNVGPGRGSLLRPERLCCVGLCGTFVCVFRGSYVAWCREASRDHGGAPHWEEGTNYSDYMRPADWCLWWWFGSRGERWMVHLSKSFSIMFGLFSWQMKRWHSTCFQCTCLDSFMEILVMNHKYEQINFRFSLDYNFWNFSP